MFAKEADLRKRDQKQSPPPMPLAGARKEKQESPPSIDPPRSPKRQSSKTLRKAGNASESTGQQSPRTLYNVNCGGGSAGGLSHARQEQPDGSEDPLPPTQRPLSRSDKSSADHAEVTARSAYSRSGQYWLVDTTPACLDCNHYRCSGCPVQTTSIRMDSDVKSSKQSRTVVSIWFCVS